MRVNYFIDRIELDIENLMRLESKAKDDFAQLVSKFGNDFILGFSGGKDSIVVSHFAKQFGITKGCCEYSFCFPRDKEQMVSISKQLGLDIEFFDSLSDAWLERNPKYIFPNTMDSGKFYSKRQQRTIKKYAKGHVGLITGRRHEENSIRDVLYKTADGLYNFHPLANWKSKDIWQYIKWKGLPYLSIYDSELGQLEGATPWCNISKTKTPNENDCWRLVYNYDNHFFKSHLVKYYKNAKQYYEKVVQGAQ